MWCWKKLYVRQVCTHVRRDCTLPLTTNDWGGGGVCSLQCPLMIREVGRRVIMTLNTNGKGLLFTATNQHVLGKGELFITTVHQ